MNLPNEPAQTDLAWCSYSGWAMLPSFIICILLSGVLLMGGWFFDDIRGLGQQAGSFIFFQITLAIWIVQLLRWLYRGATYVYRLTPNRLFLDRGFLYNASSAIDLEKVTEVHWGSNMLNRFFGVGWVMLESEGRAPELLTGILRPAAFAEAIEAAAKKSRKTPGHADPLPLLKKSSRKKIKGRQKKAK